MNRLSMPISTIQTYITGIPIEIAEIVLKFWPIKRQFIALIVMVTLGLQGSVFAFAAATPLMESVCRTSAESQDIAHKSCCPGGLHTVSCCSDLCPTALAFAATASPAPLAWYNRTAPALRFPTIAFSSRGESPLIRPPIL